MPASQPIAVFDSGLGGLTVLRALRERLPQENYFYFADTRFLPYGDKPEVFLRERGVLIAEALARQGAKAMVIACNTATAAAAEAIRAATHLPVVALEPGVKPAAASSHKRHITVLATVSTARSERLRDLVRRHAADVQVDIVPCPDWATRVEKGRLDDPAFVDSVRALLAPTLDAGSDRLVLGCTHYTFLTPDLKPFYGGTYWPWVTEDYRNTFSRPNPREVDAARAPMTCSSWRPKCPGPHDGGPSGTRK